MLGNLAINDFKTAGKSYRKADGDRFALILLLTGVALPEAGRGLRCCHVAVMPRSDRRL